jgi:hypothetical protein
MCSWACLQRFASKLQDCFVFFLPLAKKTHNAMMELNFIHVIARLIFDEGENQAKQSRTSEIESREFITLILQIHRLASRPCAIK